MGLITTMIQFVPAVVAAASATASASDSSIWHQPNDSLNAVVRSLTTTESPFSNPFSNGEEPVWWESYRAQFGKRAKKCVDVPQVPENGTPCPSKKVDEYNCFFGDQTCEADGSQHPKVKCDCGLNGIWNCGDYDPCGATQRDAWTTCPDVHPLDFPFKVTCESDFLVCNYGLQSCCGDALPASSCECIDGEFVCFNHENCKFRDCQHVPNCPETEPIPGDFCDQPPISTCAYGSYQCCNKEWKSRVHHCFEGEWDIVTDILYTECECDTPQNSQLLNSSPQPIAPSSSPSEEPSVEPSLSYDPTIHASYQPSLSALPTVFNTLPSQSVAPSTNPSVGFEIVTLPTPSVSMGPSHSLLPTTNATDSAFSSSPSVLITNSTDSTFSDAPSVSVNSSSPRVATDSSLSNSPNVSSVPSWVPSFPPPSIPETCQCQTNDDCQKPICEVHPLTGVGVCVAVTSLPPETGHPSGVPSGVPSGIPSGIPSSVPSDSPSGFSPGAPSSAIPSSVPSILPSSAPSSCNCSEPKKAIPSDCELNILIDLMETNVQAEHQLAPRWLRLGFHDAGTFDQATGEGGANGCLMNNPDMKLEPENQFLEDPINSLEAVKIQWESHPAVCVNASSADIIQFAAFFASLRQVATNSSSSPGLTSAKITRLKKFRWGRVDEPNCDPAWTINLPGFISGASGRVLRCIEAGSEIKDKMMARNGFTAREAAALIGAHTIGQIRFTFGAFLAGPWVPDGSDDATPTGPVFNNAYHDFLENAVVANSTEEFNQTMEPFDTDFGTGNWFRETNHGLDHLDTDIVMAFDSHDTDAYPNFHKFTTEFASSNFVFLNAFFHALDKMSMLGVDNSTLVTPGPCDACAPVIITPLQIIEAIKALGNATATAATVQRKRQEQREGAIENITIPFIVTEVNETEKILPFPSPLTGKPTLDSSDSPSFTPLAVVRPAGEPTVAPTTGPTVVTKEIERARDAYLYLNVDEGDDEPVGLLTAT